MTHVFISYSRKDTPFVEKLERDLKARGIVTWRDQSSIVGGTDWYHSIVSGLDESYVVLSVITTTANESDWVKREALYALQLGLKILPVLPTSQQIVRIPFYAINYQPVLCDDENYIDGVARLVTALETFDKAPSEQRQSAEKSTTSPSRQRSEMDYLNFLLSQSKADLRDARYVNLLATPEFSPQPKEQNILAFGLNDDDDFGFERLGLERLDSDDFVKSGRPIPDARTPIRELRRVILFGEPGAGKTTTLLQLAVDFAREAQKNPDAKLPIFIPLRAFNGETSFAEFVRAQMHTLQDRADILLKESRLILLCDAFNEMPRRSADGRELVAEVRNYLRDKTDWVVSCRIRDYQDDLRNLENVGKVRLKPLDPPRIYDLIRRRFADQPDLGDSLWREMHGSDDLLRAWEAFESAGESEAFWGSDWPKNVKGEGTIDYWRTPGYEDWHIMQRDLSQMLPLCRNPYMTNMICKLYATARKLPENRGALFAAFVDELLEREERACKDTGAVWIDSIIIRAGLAQLAYQMQIGGKNGVAGTEISRQDAESTLVGATHASPLLNSVQISDPALLLRLSASASLIDLAETIRFTHQLLQEYFASEIMGQVMDAGQSATSFFPSQIWWQSLGWEETAIILAGVRGDPEGVARWLAPAQPEVAYQALMDSGVEIKLDTIDPNTRSALVESANRKKNEPDPVGRAAAFRILGRLNADNRPGIGLRSNGVPDILWCEIPSGKYKIGGDKKASQSLPSQEVTIPYAYKLAKYPVTYAQFAAFVVGDGYSNPSYWTAAGWQWKGDRTHPEYGWTTPKSHIANHPVISVTWYEACAFARWLTIFYRNSQELDDNWEIRLPTETEWEVAARYPDGRQYPWGDEYISGYANINEGRIGPYYLQVTSAVGIYPLGRNPRNDLYDMSGNVWEWCLTKWRENPLSPEDNNPSGTEARTLKGGSGGINLHVTRSASRLRNEPYGRRSVRGLRVVAAPIDIYPLTEIGAY